MTTMRIVINGAKGRMGQAIIECAEADPEVEVVRATDLGDDLEAAIRDCDGVIDFSIHSITDSVAELCARNGKPLAIGTTGQTDEQRKTVEEASRAIPIVFAPNFSVGINTMFWLTEKAATALGEDFDIEVVEMHHRMKKDAPSGTARRLGEILASTRELDYSRDTRHGRKGITEERTRNEIGMHALRGGDVVGDHTVVFAAEGERLEITHKASSRRTFAKGAIRALQWATKAGPGLYDMQDVLGLREP